MTEQPQSYADLCRAILLNNHQLPLTHAVPTFIKMFSASTCFCRLEGLLRLFDIAVFKAHRAVTVVEHQRIHKRRVKEIQHDLRSHDFAGVLEILEDAPSMLTIERVREAYRWLYLTEPPKHDLEGRTNGAALQWVPCDGRLGHDVSTCRAPERRARMDLPVIAHEGPNLTTRAEVTPPPLLPAARIHGLLSPPATPKKPKPSRPVPPLALVTGNGATFTSGEKGRNCILKILPPRASTVRPSVQHRSDASGDASAIAAPSSQRSKSLPASTQRPLEGVETIGGYYKLVDGEPVSPFMMGAVVYQAGDAARSKRGRNTVSGPGGRSTQDRAVLPSGSGCYTPPHSPGGTPEVSSSRFHSVTDTDTDTDEDTDKGSVVSSAEESGWESDVTVRQAPPQPRTSAKRKQRPTSTSSVDDREHNVSRKIIMDEKRQSPENVS